METTPKVSIEEVSEIEYLELPTGTPDERFDGYVRLLFELFRSDDPDETSRKCLRALVDLANSAGDDPERCASLAHVARVMGEELGLAN